MKIYVTVYTKEEGKLKLTRDQWYDLHKFLIYHKEDGPAVEHVNGDKSWYIDNKLHREDGPAREYVDGTKFWYVNDKNYSEADYNKLLEEVNSLEPILGLIDPREWVRKRFERKYKV